MLIISLCPHGQRGHRRTRIATTDFNNIGRRIIIFPIFRKLMLNIL